MSTLPKPSAPVLRKRLLLIVKLVVSFGILGFVYWKLISTTGSQELWARIKGLAWGWLGVGIVAQLVAMSCSILRWQRLLIGQGIHAPLRHLLGTFMIGRFFAELAPGGWTGLNGYRIYDIAKRTGKIARASATIGIEMVLGWLSFSAVVVAGSVYGVRFMGVTGVVVVDLFFVSLIVLALLLTSRPVLFRHLAQRLPGKLAGQLRTTTDAVCAYEGKSGLLVQAALLGVGTHFFRAFIYISAARALAADLSVGEVLFGSSLQVFATFLPASVNGIGLREATAVALYTRGGIPESTAVLIPTLGFLLELALSSLGGIVFLSRRDHYQVAIRVDYAEHEDQVRSEIPPVPESEWPRTGRGTLLGLGAGLLAGAALGCSEVLLVLGGAHHPGSLRWTLLPYGVLTYALPLAALGAALGALSSWTGRLVQRKAQPPALAYARGAACLFASMALAVGSFRLRRDVFHEELRWASGPGLLVLLGCIASALVVYALAAALLRALTTRRFGAWLLRPWGTPLLVAGIGLGLAGLSLAHGDPPPPPLAARPPAAAGANNVLFVVVDTLRADHLPSYGYRAGHTPALDQLAADAVRFEAAYANASWTRPSFASILTGRFAASHRTMAKSDALPDELVTLPEALRDGGYHTFGVVTNFNIAPFFNFDQGFDRYTYLAPDFVLGADDASAKLLLVQALRQLIETTRAKRGQVPVGSAYRDAAELNRALLAHLNEPARGPFFLFAAYMDPHDPYYAHPYNGTAYSRAAHPRPKPEEAAGLVRLYDGEITYWDEHFGALLAALKHRGLYDDMTIVVTSDHGEEFNEHGGFWHGATLYDEALHVPLFVKLPQNQLRGSVVRHFVQSIDLMPSVLGLSGLPIPAGVQGQDVFSGHESVFAEESHEGNVLSAVRVLRGGSAVKLIRSNPDNPRHLAPSELYQLDRDPHEQVNVASEEPDLARVLDTTLSTQADDAARGRATPRKVDPNRDPTAVERLRALGYAGGDKPEGL
ncbi:MAG: sulfatase-like hydrolase/transferase [Polyangiales bacterium]